MRRLIPIVLAVSVALVVVGTAVAAKPDSKARKILAGCSTRAAAVPQGAVTLKTLPAAERRLQDAWVRCNRIRAPLDLLAQQHPRDKGLAAASAADLDLINAVALYGTYYGDVSMRKSSPKALREAERAMAQARKATRRALHELGD